MLKWATAHESAWKELEKEHNLKPGLVLEEAGWDFMDISLLLAYERVYDNTARVEQLGFVDEEVDFYASLERAWRDYAAFGHLPPL